MRKRADTAAGLRKLCSLVKLLLCAARSWGGEGCRHVRRAIEDNGYVIDGEGVGCPPETVCIATQHRRELGAVVSLGEGDVELRVAVRRSFLASVLGRLTRRSNLEEDEVEEVINILLRMDVAEDHDCEELFEGNLCDNIRSRNARIYALKVNLEKLLNLAEDCSSCLRLLERLSEQ